MANVKRNEVKEKYFLYTDFKKTFDSLGSEDQAVLTPYLSKLFQDWNEAIDKKSEEDSKRRLQ
jgi:hypothetical protein